MTTIVNEEMTEITTIVSEDQNLIQTQIYEGGLTVVNTGSGGSAGGVTLNPPIAAFPGATTVQEALEQAATSIITIPTINLGGHRAVYFSPNGLEYSDNRFAVTSYSIGITTGAVNAGGQAIIKTTGKITEPSWSWVVPGLIFLGQNGLLTQSSPSPPAVYSQIIGVADTSTSIVLNIQPPIFLN